MLARLRTQPSAAVRRADLLNAAYNGLAPTDRLRYRGASMTRFRLAAPTCAAILGWTSAAASQGLTEPVRSAPQPSSRAAFGTAASPHPAASWRMASGALFSVAVSMAPDPVWSVPLYLEAASESDRPGAPSFRLVFDRTRSGDIVIPQGTAHLSWTVGRLEACVVGWRGGPSLRAQPCIMAEAGALAASAAGVRAPASTIRPWIALGALGRFQWFVVPDLFLEVQTGLRFPLIRDRFYEESGLTVHDVPPVGGFAAFGMGTCFL
jgi:hypothetical protein